MKTILVAGDLTRDFNLARSRRSANQYDATVPFALLQERAGGAWYLRELVELACSDLDVQVVGPAADAPARKAYTIWSTHARARGDKSEVWRIEQFLGCEPTLDEASAVAGMDAGLSDPDVLVLDDLGLDFRANPELWPATLRGETRGPGAIVLKLSAPVAEGALWDVLLDKYADRLTVLVTADALRARRADIAPGRSWDLTIEDTCRELLFNDSAFDLGCCNRTLVQFGVAGVASYRNKDGRTDFERFVYQPEELEGDWAARHPGQAFGAQSILLAAVVRHVCDPATYPLFIALGRGLAAVRRSHEIGAGFGRFDLAADRAQISAAYHAAPDVNGNNSEPAAEFCTAFPHWLLSDIDLRSQEPQESDLIRDVAGIGIEYYAAKGTEVVLRGPAAALAAAPKARYGHYFTVDREEIERINSIRALILSYQQNPNDRKPLSIAVFGQPGSGKSFAIKQLAAELFGGQNATLEFNLGQFEDVGELHAAFHQVRDASLLGQIPLVFWDEFDSGNLRWLKSFLAPMQDGEFQEGSHIYHLGRAIFVFAGGTCFDFDSFDRTYAESDVRDAFRAVKGPDFVSRLRGSLNIKGPNPTSDDDSAHILRRAILLRSLLERNHPQLIDSKTRRAAVSTSVIRGFLRVEKYLHGARSLEMIVTSSRPDARFEPAALPGPEILRSHVSANFRQHVDEGELEGPVIEALAEACHAGWYEMRSQTGWRHGATRDDAKQLHPMLRPYEELSEAEKERNRITARLTHAKLLELGYRVVRFSADDRRNPPLTAFEPDERERLMQIEHDIWLRDHLLRGYEYAPTTNEQLRLHRDIVPFNEQLAEDRALDEAIVAAIPPTLLKRQYKLVKAE